MKIQTSKALNGSNVRQQLGNLANCDKKFLLDLSFIAQYMRLKDFSIWFISIFSEPRRRQSVCRVGSQIFLFGGTSPHEGPHVHFTQEQLQFMPDNQPKNLIDHNDTYVLDLKPSLRSLCMDFVIQNSHHYNLECLPQGIKYDIDCMTKDDTISEPLKFKGLPLG